MPAKTGQSGPSFLPSGRTPRRRLPARLPEARVSPAFARPLGYNCLVDTPDPIPLHEAVARDLIPCSVCGAKGADVQKADGEKHFLCAACAARGRRWKYGLLIALLAGLGVVVAIKLNSPPPTTEAASPLDSPEERQRILNEILDLMNQRNFSGATRKIASVLVLRPNDPLLNLYMATCLDNQGYFARSIGHYQAAMADPTNQKTCRSSIGQALQFLGHSAQALPFLEDAVAGSPPDDRNRVLLAECYIDLERYTDGLKMLEGFPPQEVILRHRHRALLYQGKPEEARKVYEGTEAAALKGSKERSLILQAMQAREDGDFEAALKTLNEARAKADPKSFDAVQYLRMALMVYIESGDVAKLNEESAGLLKLASEVTKVPQKQLMGEAMFYQTVGLLLAGKRDDAVASAKKFLASIDQESGIFRVEALVMQFLAGIRKEQDLAGEAAQVNRFRANDMYYYMALISGNADWAKKAADATPGHNFPYHAIQRLLKK